MKLPDHLGTLGAQRHDGVIAKPEPRKKSKRRAKRVQGDHVAAIREYVFDREWGVCRCCSFRGADSMHEIRPKSLRGKVSRTNSIAVCGSGTTGCHGFLQTRKIVVEGEQDAEHTLHFVPMTEQAAEHVKVKRGQQIASGPYPQIRERA